MNAAILHLAQGKASLRDCSEVLGKNVSVNAVAMVTELRETKLREILLVKFARADPRWPVLARRLEAFLIERRWYRKIMETWRKCQRGNSSFVSQPKYRKLILKKIIIKLSVCS